MSPEPAAVAAKAVPATPEAKETVVARDVEAVSKPAPVLPEAGAFGPAYFAVESKGVYRLEGGEFSRVKSGPETLIKQMSIGADGGAYMLTREGIMALDGAAAKMVAKTSYEKTGNVDAFAVTAAGEVWVAGYNGVGHYAGKTWTVMDKATLGEGVTLLRGVAVDREGRVWVASSNALHYKEPGADAWSEADVSGATSRKPFFKGVGFDRSTGGVVAVASSRVLSVTGPDAIKAIAMPDDALASFELLSFASNGLGAVKTGAKGVARLEPGGSVTSYAMDDDFLGTRVVALTVDGQGRVWVASELGVSVVGPGDARARWMMGSVPEIAGKVKGVLVVGAGPALPDVGAQKTGGLRGIIVVDGKPIADAEIEICPEPSPRIKATPCEDSPIKASGKTDANGTFAFADVPVGAYGVGVKVGEAWKITFGGAYGAKMNEGDDFDIGTLKFTTK
ncbi:MAG: hypothetical protein AAGA54_03415 [Myxococcota bacterium]